MPTCTPCKKGTLKNIIMETKNFEAKIWEKSIFFTL